MDFIEEVGERRGLRLRRGLCSLWLRRDLPGLRPRRVLRRRLAEEGGRICSMASTAGLRQRRVLLGLRLRRVLPGLRPRRVLLGLRLRRILRRRICNCADYFLACGRVGYGAPGPTPAAKARTGEDEKLATPDRRGRAEDLLGSPTLGGCAGWRNPRAAMPDDAPARHAGSVVEWTSTNRPRPKAPVAAGPVPPRIAGGDTGSRRNKSVEGGSME